MGGGSRTNVGAGGAEVLMTASCFAVIAVEEHEDEWVSEDIGKSFGEIDGEGEDDVTEHGADGEKLPLPWQLWVRQW